MNKRLAIIVLAIVTAGFCFGLIQLFRLRFEAGDVYPEYSSLRADPLGTMAVYESLSRMPGMAVRRDYSSQNQLPEPRGVTYLHLAAEREEWTSLPEDLVQEIEGFLAGGGRLVITFLPQTSAPFPSIPGPTMPSGKKSSKKAQAEADRLLRRTSLHKRWGFEFGYMRLPKDANDDVQPVRVANQTDISLPHELEWHSGMTFTNLANAWRPIYSRDTNAVVIERHFGPGSVLMATDSYFLSNEAMSKDRHADLIAWLIGPARQVVFDEAHLGIIDTSGVAGLMRKYRLHGLMAGLLLVAALYVWKNSFSFVPPYPAARQTEIVAGKEAAAGFVNLLRRNIAPRDLLRVCFEEWTKSQVTGGRHSIGRVDAAQAVLEAEAARAKVEQDPVRAYREICRALRNRQGV